MRTHCIALWGLLVIYSSALSRGVLLCMLVFVLEWERGITVSLIIIMLLTPNGFVKEVYGISICIIWLLENIMFRLQWGRNIGEFIIFIVACANIVMWHNEMCLVAQPTGDSIVNQSRNQPHCVSHLYGMLYVLCALMHGPQCFISLNFYHLFTTIRVQR